MSTCIRHTYCTVKTCDSISVFSIKHVNVFISRHSQTIKSDWLNYGLEMIKLKMFAYNTNGIIRFKPPSHFEFRTGNSD